MLLVEKERYDIESDRTIPKPSSRQSYVSFVEFTAPDICAIASALAFQRLELVRQNS